MKIDETIISINKKARTYSKSFLAMGVVATAIANIPAINLVNAQMWEFLFVLIGLISWGSLTSQNIIKNKIAARESPDLGILAYPSFYKIPFNNRFNEYLKKSENDMERKFKIILTSYALKKLVIEPSTVFNHISDKEYNWTVKYNILNSEGKSQPLFDYVTRHVDYMDLTANDLKIPQNLAIAKKVYKDFSNLGLLGREIVGLNKFNDNAQFLMTLNDYKLTATDILEIEKNIKFTSGLDDNNRRTLRPDKGREEEFIFEIIENNTEHIEVLRKFYTLHHVHKDNCSYPELIGHLDNLFIVSQRKDALNTMLVEKIKKPVKTKKL